MKLNYYIGLDLGLAQYYTASVVLERPASSGLCCRTSPRFAFHLPECRLPADRTRNGKNTVHAVMMPTVFTCPGSLTL